MKQRGKLRLFGHPVHPVVTHFPMALLPVSLLGDLLGVWTDASFWWSFSFYNLAIGLVMSIPALITGTIDFLVIPQKGAPERIALRHMTIMISAITMYAASFFIRIGVETPFGWRLTSSISLSFLGLIFLLIGGWLGGQLVYRHAIGSKPND
ncbi:DUF2231 domain-containing protein [Lederbergia panacisoli]|uniref:DUF2231 domain-containing protein n=1 Tax=Lederbergia panacisoli TaxID=1255251 RepID=UPI00214C4DED|nr:DUF2231 domain-containing protein [Lederbergia panacisoli]MCR2822766.1 DUF2231 domain-containing protein [Lederbergia panacisoli]